MKKVLLYLVLLAPFFAVSQVYREWVGATSSWNTASNWSPSGIAYAQLEWKNNGVATSTNDAGNPYNAWRLYFGGNKSYTLTGNPVTLFDFGGNNSWVLCQSPAPHNMNVNLNVNFYDGGLRTSWITTQNTGTLTFGGAIDIGGGVTALRISGLFASGVLTFNGAISGSTKPVDIGNDETGTTQTGTRVFFNATNTYSGPTTIYGGVLSVPNNSALGTGNLNIGNGSNSTVIAVTGTTTRTQNLNIQDTSSAGAVDVASGQIFTLSGNLVGGGTNTTKYGKAGAGTFVVSGSSNTYNGQLQIGEGVVRVESSLGTNASTSNRGVDLGLNVGDTSTANNVSLQAVNGITVGQSIYVAPNTGGATRTIALSGSGSATFNNEIYLGGTATLNAGSGTLNFTGNLTNAGGVVVNGGTVVYSGTAKTYTGATNVTAGTLSVVKTGYTATITTSGINVAFSPAPAKGNYTVLTGALSSSASLSTSGLSPWQTASFNAATGVLTVFDTPSVSLVSNDGDNTFCAGTNVTFTATASNVGAGTIAYDFKVNGSSVQNSASNTFSTSGLTNGQAVTVEITVTGGTFLSSNTATSNSISNTVQALPASAGSNGTLSICSTTTLTTALLYGALTGSPAPGGTWSPAPAGAGTYTYTQAATSPCTVDNTATVVVTVQQAPASAGSNGTLAVCSTTTLTTALLYGALTGSPAPGGVWSPAPAGAGTYTYTQAATSPCTVDNTATVVVTVQSAPASAGSNGTLLICSTTTLTTSLLYSALTGSPAPGGAWSPAPSGAGTYTYTQAAISPCTVDNTAQVVVSITTALTWYQDSDGDGYGNSAVSQVTCSNLSPAYSLVGGDCNDAVAGINPGAAEICYNNIDDNCDTILSDGCAPVVVNMTPSYNGSTLPSLATAVPAVAYTYAPYTIKYRFRITNITTGITAPDVIQVSRYVTIPASIHSYNAQYSIQVSAVINEEVVPFAGNTIIVNSPSVSLITLNTASCGATLASLTSTLTANPGLNATGYTFRIRLNDANPSPTYAFSQSSTRFVSANSFTGFPLQYATSYKVAVQYTFNDPVTNLPTQSGYGAECTVNTPSIPLTRIVSPTCGSQVATMNAGITAQAASYATGYQFRIRLFSDNGPTPTYYYTAVNPSRFSSLANFQGITLAYNTEYSISVQYSITQNASTVWSGYGAECKVTTPFFPVTSLVTSQCGLATPTSLTQQLNITPYPGFPHYMVKLEELNGEDVVDFEEREIEYSYFRLSDFAIASLGKNYSVSVKIKLNGVFGDYDTACDLFTADPGKTVAIIPFKATAYPNPFANNFMLDVKTTTQSSVNLKVYDMVGRLIEQREVSVSDMQTMTIGDRYPTGVYNVVVSQEDSVQTVRVVKR